MVRGRTLLTGLRVLAVVAALAVVGLGIWSKIIVHDLEIRGISLLETAKLEAQTKEEYWRDYFTTVLNGVLRIWISIGTAAFASLLGIFVVLATLRDRMRTSAAVLISIECLSTSAMATSFGTSFSVALNLDAFSQNRLDSSNSPELQTFVMLIPLSKGYVVAVGAGWFLLLMACTSAIISTINRARVKESCSFEPTASALGIAHGYQAVMPVTPRDRVPTMYDPRRPLRGEPVASTGEEEKGFAGKGVDMGRRDSGLSEMGKDWGDVEKSITGPLNLEKPERVLQIRPSRPWSEAPRKKEQQPFVHAM